MIEILDFESKKVVPVRLKGKISTQALTDAIVTSARGAVELAIGLVGLMAFFLGLMRVVEDAGMLRHLARLIGPVMRRLFPGVPLDGPMEPMP